MSFLLLTDQSLCPVCNRRTRPSHFRQCSFCGTMLFLREINFRQYEEDGAVRNYWLWTEARGWVHRDHVMERIARALEREQNIKMPEPNRSTTPGAIAAHSGKITKKVRKK